MVCSDCSLRSVLLASLAPAIEALGLGRWELLGLLALPDAELCSAVGVRVPSLAPLASADRARGLCPHDPRYPPSLLQLPSPPSALYVAGDSPALLPELLSHPVVALVGSRRSTYYARDIASSLARDLSAAGVTVLGGLALGVGGSAQHGALAAGGRPLLVMGGGASVALPVQHDRLHARVLAAGGLSLSELPPRFASPPRWCFLARNRLIAALADVVVVVEAGARSGTLFTAELALRLGREVAVVPGRTSDASAAGSNALLRDGAQVVLDASDVLGLLDRLTPSLAARSQTVAAAFG